MKKMPFVPLPAGAHQWSFAKIGGFNQVLLKDGEDLRHLGELDEKLWSALSCPTKGLEFDPATLELIDTDHDGRIRVAEIRAAVAWVCSRVRDPAVIMAGSDALRLADIDANSPDGAPILASAKHVLQCLGKGDSDAIALDDVLNRAAIFAESELNGDGVVPPAAARDATLSAVIADIVKVAGGVPDRSGVNGVDQAELDEFFDHAAKYVEWKNQVAGSQSIMPLGEKTAAAYDKFQAVRAKIDDYFARCRLAAFDRRSLAALNREEKDYLTLAARDMTISDDEIQALPLAAVDVNRPLPLMAGVNPAWIDRMAAFHDEVAVPLLGNGVATLTHDQWLTISGKLEPYGTWIKTRPAGDAFSAIEALGDARLKEIVEGGARQAITDLIAADKAVEGEAKAIDDLQRLLYFNKHLFRLLTNFVSFTAFYQREQKAVFQAGTLYLDNRSCDLCVRVSDMSKHTLMAGSSRMYLLYCDCVRPSGEKMQIAAAVTDGDSDDLIVGRNGVFYDMLGRDWDATITKIIENPIGVRQAFWSPYKRLMRFVEEQVAKRAAAKDAAADASLKDAASKAPAAAASTADGKPPAPPKSKFDVGVVAALGVAVGGITAAFGALMGVFFGLGAWMPIAVVAILLAISGPSMFIASLKLRQRNLGPLLDANGWAINAKARVNIVFGRGLTKLAELPAGATCTLTDPYAKKKHRKWPWIIVLVLVLIVGGGLFCWKQGLLNEFLPDSLDHNPPKVEVVIDKAVADKAVTDKAATP